MYSHFSGLHIIHFSNTPNDGLLQPNARTTDESFSGSSAASLQGRPFPFSDAQLLFAVRLVSRVSRLRQGHLQHWKSRVLLRFPLHDNLRGGLSPPPSKRKDPAGFRLLRQRRSCGTSSW